MEKRKHKIKSNLFAIVAKHMQTGVAYGDILVNVYIKRKIYQMKKQKKQKKQRKQKKTI